MIKKNSWLVTVFGGYDSTFKKTALGNLARVHIVQNQEIIDSEALQALSLAEPQITQVFACSSDLENRIYRIRWFNKGHEIQRCGHGSLAASYVLCELWPTKRNILYTQSNSESNTVLFKSFFNETIRSYSTTLASHSEIKHYSIEFCISILEKAPCDVTNNAFFINIYGNVVAQTPKPNGYTIIEAEKPIDIFNYTLNAKSLKQNESRAVIYFSRNNPQPTEQTPLIIFRYFAPQYGVKEDSATGSAAAILAQYLFEHHDIIHTQMFQASPENGGILHTVANQDLIRVSGQVILAAE